METEIQKNKDEIAKLDVQWDAYIQMRDWVRSKLEEITIQKGGLSMINARLEQNLLQVKLHNERWKNVEK